MSAERALPIGTPEEFRAAILDEGRRMLFRERGEVADLPAVIWRLLQDATETARSIAAPGPGTRATSWPDINHDFWEVYAAYRERIADEIEVATRETPYASAAQMGRYLEVMSWLRWAGGHNPAKTQKLLVALASGMTHSRAARHFGLSSRKAVETRKYRALRNIAARLTRPG